MQRKLCTDQALLLIPFWHFEPERINPVKPAHCHCPAQLTSEHLKATSKQVLLATWLNSNGGALIKKVTPCWVGLVSGLLIFPILAVPPSFEAHVTIVLFGHADSLFSYVHSSRHKPVVLCGIPKNAWPSCISHFVNV